MRLEEAVGAALKAQGATICTAESCTGGLIAYHLTTVSGSSAYVLGSVVAYDNRIKVTLLNVREAILMAHGAVSEATAREMAVNARALFGADYALSVTGIAGPSGGTAEKPIGLTYIGLATPQAVIVERHVWPYDRIGNQNASADAALQLLLRTMQGEGRT